ncbi:maleylpyruvate isomerase N-terminal domain-containing protein [Actinocrispum wychmicini]|nr:maleylpyruvate isomerase N-terminal domain-containing protein [Actinocrispum wychmicini]
MARPPVLSLLEQSYQDTAEMLGGIGDAGWVAQSGCARWTVRQAGNHLGGALGLLGGIAGGGAIDPSEVDAQRAADIPGERLAGISSLESLVHGWDIASGAAADPFTALLGHLGRRA